MANFHQSRPLKDGEFVSSIQPESASACSEFLEDQQPPKAQTVSTWQRFVRAVRAWWYGRMKP